MQGTDPAPDSPVQSVAHAHAEPDASADPAAFWEQRYADAGAVWSGRVNATLADLVAGIEAERDGAFGRALDLGCGEGGDVVWLASRGWHATGVDISPTAIERGRAAATSAGVPTERIRFIAADLATWAPDAGSSFDLVTASFLQSPVELPRSEILRRATSAVAPGGHLLVVSHAAPPPWAKGLQGHDHVFPTPADEAASLDLDPGAWSLEVCEVRRREATGPDGERATLDDGVLLARRR